MDATVRTPTTVTAEDDQDIGSRALDWLRGELPAHPFDGLEELECIDVPTAVVPPGRGDILDQLFPPDNLLRIRVERRFTGDRLENYRLCASGLVGISTVGKAVDAESFATVTVRPKVPGSSLLTMLSYALVPDLSSEHRPGIDIKEAPVVSLIVLIYLLRLQQLIEGHGLQRAYIHLAESLRGTIRGRCMLPTYLRRNLPTGRAHAVPCDFWELRVDSEPNRALRWGVEVCRMLADWLSQSELSRLVESLWMALAPHFSGIPLESYQASEVRRLPRSGRFAPYEPVFELLEFLLDNLSFDIVKGRVRVRGFAVEMWRVFERFVVNVLASHMRAQILGPQVEREYHVRDEEHVLQKKSIFLDALIKGQRTLVLDAKWKEGIVSYANSAREEAEMLQLEDLHIRNADLFQVVAYGRHESVQAEGSLLVYPVLNPDSVCRQRCIRDFLDAREERQVFPVFLVGIPVGEALHQSIEDFVGLVQEIAAGPVTTQDNSRSRSTDRKE
jgi:5-methylcytosine-specific restriction endonuclease McrBC regulatory subunit McrC